MLIKDEAIVLRGARSGETSRHVTVFGRQSGKIKLLAKGALAPRSPLRGALEPGNVLDVVYYHREGRTLHFLKEVGLVRSAGRLRDSLPRLAAVLAALELLDAVCYWGSPEPRIVDLYDAFERGCESTPDTLLFFLVFELKLLEILGLLPDFFSCNVCSADLENGFYHPAEGASACREHSAVTADRIAFDGALRVIIEAIHGESVAALSATRVEGSLRRRLGKVLHWTYTFHIQGYRLPESLRLIDKP